jgi:hypothetical protein
MNWQDQPIPNDDEGQPMFKGNMDLFNDREERLGSVLWFYDGGPYYAFAVDPREPDVVRRIGPCMTLDAAKESVVRGASGQIENLNKRAGYPNEQG